MSGSFYGLVVDPRRQRLTFSMRRGLRITLGVLWSSITLALGPAVLPGSGVVITPEGWGTALVIWSLVTVGLGWRDAWRFEALGRLVRIRGWGPLVTVTSSSLEGFGGWSMESHGVHPLAPRRCSLGFQTAAGRWTIDSRFRAEWLEVQRPALELWVDWWKGGQLHGK